MDMENSKPLAGRRRVLACGLAMGLTVLFNCFGFPVYNLGREWPLFLTASYLFLTPASAVFMGGVLSGCFPGKGLGFKIPLVTVLVLAGLGCRFLLEFGEVSNTYNFTLPNVLLHTAVFAAFCCSSWRAAGERQGTAP